MRTATITLLILLTGCASGQHKEEQSTSKSNLPQIPKNVLFSSYRICLRGTSNGVYSIGIIGSAVGISKHTLLTAAHLETPVQMLHLDPGYTYMVDVFDEDGIELHLFDATMTKKILQPTGQDLAILEIKEELPHYVKFDPSVKTDVGDWVYTIGAQSGQSPFNVGWGQVASKMHEEFHDLWQTSVSVSGGNSGGGVFDARTNKLIGIMVRGQQLSLFVPNNLVAEFLK